MQNSQIKTVTTYPSIVGGVLAQMRGQQSLHQEDVAKAVGVTQTTWSRIENGQSSISVEHLRLAASKLGIQPNRILQYADQAATNMEFGGVEVMAARNDTSLNPAVVLLAGAALGAIIMYAIANSK